MGRLPRNRGSWLFWAARITEAAMADSTGLCVYPIHFWHHFFGLSMTLKIGNCPQKESKSVRIMVWRCELPPEVYRRLCVMVNWQVQQLQKEQCLESE